MAVDEVDGTLAAMGPRLRAAREQHGATLAGISCATGISPSTLSRIETGRRKPTLEVVLRLAKEYGVSLDELAGTTRPSGRAAYLGAAELGDSKVVLRLTRYVGGLHPTSMSCLPCPALPVTTTELRLSIRGPSYSALATARVSSAATKSEP
ncbi:transcriptional regulator with XRE-family HTH domain [Streptomyces turgidiscabies]|uniref:Transcriptional regulator with XRE-family HTH domain n=1 Tax=Streptomyces turgidiscabies TaxID=85558 RepID=A0ABU0RUY5_9ACTN|nr:helix-turn-helix transcriptional regulator [Streptomyces turgidiscabies]MDQ0935766.1 transcriptional regulator with XRE-family HTH domain [Streptomyces turgidiscabies]